MGAGTLVTPPVYLPKAVRSNCAGCSGKATSFLWVYSKHCPLMGRKQVLPTRGGQEHAYCTDRRPIDVHQLEDVRAN